ncbi:MAG TPA: amidase, partial [Gemmataceae bacterium]|nr:amidase [Gemmataceae bacterium]
MMTSDHRTPSAMPPTIHAAAEDIRHGRVTPLALLDTCLGKIDRSEERVRAWVSVHRDSARADAERLTEEQRRGHWRGPLHGIPLGIKDIIDVFDWPTAAGSALWAKSVARHDATVVQRLRQAGAVLVGKTVTTQYASFDPPPTRNPWNVERTPGGSSSGSAAALACGMCLGALGSQTGGSITRPASFCGVAGCKPTYGRVSVHGIVPLAASMDHPGPMARSVHDLAILLRAIAGPDAYDPLCSNRSVPDYPALLEHPLQPPCLGLVRGLFQDMLEPEGLEFMDEVERILRRGGATLKEVALPASFAEVLPRHRIVMAVEAAAYHEPRLRRHPSDYGPNITQLLEEGLACPAPEYARTKEHQRQLTREMLGCFEDVDVLLTPATRGPAPAAATTGDPAFNSPWSYTGLPTVSLPGGWTADGLPLSIQLVGRPWKEAQVLAAAAWC